MNDEVFQAMDAKFTELVVGVKTPDELAALSHAYAALSNARVTVKNASK